MFFPFLVKGKKKKNKKKTDRYSTTCGGALNFSSFFRVNKIATTDWAQEEKEPRIIIPKKKEEKFIPFFFFFFSLVSRLEMSQKTRNITFWETPHLLRTRICIGQNKHPTADNPTRVSRCLLTWINKLTNNTAGPHLPWPSSLIWFFSRLLCVSIEWNEIVAHGKENEKKKISKKKRNCGCVWSPSRDCLWFLFVGGSGTDRIGYERISLHWPHNTKESRVERATTRRERKNEPKRRRRRRRERLLQHWAPPVCKWMVYSLRSCVGSPPPLLHTQKKNTQTETRFSFKRLQIRSHICWETRRGKPKFNGRPTITSQPPFFLRPFLFLLLLL